MDARTTERDAARTEVVAGDGRRNEPSAELETRTAERDVARAEAFDRATEREEARKEVVTRTTERDTIRAEVVTGTDERDEARNELDARTAELGTTRTAYEAEVGELKALVAHEMASARTVREVQRKTIGHHLEHPRQVQVRMTALEIERDLVKSQL